MNRIVRLKYCIILLVSFFSFVPYNLSAKGNKPYNSNDVLIVPLPEKIVNDSKRRNTPSVIIEWGKDNLPNEDGKYSFFIKSPVSFSYFGIGWKIDSPEKNPSDFSVFYRTGRDSFIVGEWKTVEGLFSPEETPSNMYRSDIILIADSLPHEYCEVVLVSPDDVSISDVRMDFVNIKRDLIPSHIGKSADRIYGTNDCLQPSIIPRSEWCGGFSACQEPGYIPDIIQPTHVILHHGGSPDFYLDGYSVVRSYWDYHVNSLGWIDIGYNYLIDKYGNIFQGRFNTSMSTQDVKGSHSGSVNGRAIGVCFPGNSDITITTNEQVSKLEKLLSWWFNWRKYDPTSKGLIINQAGTDTLYLPRMVGHRDVKPSTICPGDKLYSLLPRIRVETKEQLFKCSGIEVTTDLYIENEGIEPSGVLAGNNITVNCRYSIIGNLNNQDDETATLGIWLSTDTVFNPAKDKLLLEFNDDSLGYGKQSTLISETMNIDRHTNPGNYYVFLVADSENECWESNETNNEKCFPLTIYENNSTITVSVHPFNGGEITGVGKYANGDTCRLVANCYYGYLFSGWYEEDTLISSLLYLEFTAKQNRNIEAVFKCANEGEYKIISGDFFICQGEKGIKYSIPGIINGISYDWTLPFGAGGKKSHNTIIVDFSENARTGFINVVVDIGCKYFKPESMGMIEVFGSPQKPELTIENGVLYSNHIDNEQLFYQWYRDTVKIEGGGFYYYKPEDSGVYYLIESTQFCTSLPSDKIFFDFKKFFTCNEYNAVRIFPNPTKGIIEIVYSEYQENGLKIEFYDNSLRLRYKFTDPGGANYYTTDISGLESGLYFIRYYINGEVFWGKVFKK